MGQMSNDTNRQAEDLALQDWMWRQEETGLNDGGKRNMIGWSM